MPPKKQAEPRVVWTLRLPASLNREIEALAQAEYRSVNAQVVYILERWLEQQNAEKGR